MKPELQAKLVEYLETMEGAVTASKDFVAREAPLVVQEYLTWCFWEACLWMTLNSIIVALFLTVWSRPCLRLAKSDTPEDVFGGLGLALGGAAAIGLSYSAVYNALTALQITIAPRVFLLERIAELVK